MCVCVCVWRERERERERENFEQQKIINEYSKNGQKMKSPNTLRNEYSRIGNYKLEN